MPVNGRSTPASLDILRSLINEPPNRDRIERLFLKSLKVLDEALKAKRIFNGGRRAATIDGGPDHASRLAAAKQIIELLEAATPPPGQMHEPGTVTWESFLRLRQTTTQPVPVPPQLLPPSAETDGPAGKNG